MSGETSEREARKRKEREEAKQTEARRALERELRDAWAATERTDRQAALLDDHPQLVQRWTKRDAKKGRSAASRVESEEPAAVLDAKVQLLAGLVRDAASVVFYTGAGISTAASIPDYRGPNGIWTQRKRQRGGGGGGGSRLSASAASRAAGVDKKLVRPTAAHMALASLARSSRVSHIVSQNVDGLHLRSGVPASVLCELHGNVFKERCPGCDREYLRDFDVSESSSFRRHETGRTCEARGCEERPLRDTIVYFGERIHAPTLEAAQRAARNADLAVFVGSSLKVLQHYPYIWERKTAAAHKKRFVIVNLQPTPKDRVADLIIRGRADAVLERLVRELGCPVTDYEEASDPILGAASLKGGRLKVE